MQAAAVEVLVKKGKFEPHIALAVGEAIDMSINSAQLITVPILDARFSAMEAKMNTLRADLVRWVFLVMLGNVALSTGTAAILNFLQR